jgi:tRNA threonylcarbamoyladenosine biosynthesis protein TsaE
MEMTLIAPTAEDTREIGSELAELLAPGDRILLSGELGSGKTTFVQGVVRGLGAEEDVVSPTFTLIREYPSGRLPVAHVDLYRLVNLQEVLDLALEEVSEDAVVLVEWGDVVEDLIGSERLLVDIASSDPSWSDEARRITLRPEGQGWVGRWPQIEGSRVARWFGR